MIKLKRKLPTLYGNIEAGSFIKCQPYMEEKLVRIGRADKVWRYELVETPSETIDEVLEALQEGIASEEEHDSKVAEDTSSDTTRKKRAAKR